jgi:hypothetical protein
LKKIFFMFNAYSNHFSLQKERMNYRFGKSLFIDVIS